MSNIWLEGARPKTLPAAIVPVAVGTAAVWDHAVWWRALLALVVAVAIQVGTNYANDYSDGIRGTDGPDRVGPVRLVGSGLATARSVKTAAHVSFGVAAAAGLVLCAVAGWWLLAVGAVSLLAGWYYTGGSKPYGYLGFGELFVFVFFGLVATIGSAYVHTESFDGLRLAVLASIPVGLLAVSLMLTNNLRDRPTDAAVGKNTLAVRLGDRNTRWLFAGLFVLSYLLVLLIALDAPWALLALNGALLAVSPVGTVLGGASGAALLPVLGATGRTQMVTGALLAVGLALS